MTSSCVSNFPFSQLQYCNGHGFCDGSVIGQGICLCFEDYGGNHIDMFADPSDVHCLLSRVTMRWVFMSILMLTGLVLVRLFRYNVDVFDFDFLGTYIGYIFA